MQSSAIQKATCDFLKENGWKEYPNGFKRYARCLYRNFNTKTPCCLNNEKNDIQIEISVSEDGAMELELNGQMKDCTWFKIFNYCLPKDSGKVVELIPRMLTIWEVAANCDK